MSFDDLETLREELKAFEDAKSKLEPSRETLQEWKSSVDEYCFDFLDSLETSKVYSFKNNKIFQSIDFNEKPKSLDSLVELLKSEYNDSGIIPSSGDYMAFIGGGGLYPSALGDYIASITNKYSGVVYGCPAAVDIENKVIKWIAKLFGFPDDATGNICSGTSTGILYSIHVARDARRIKCEMYSKLVIYCNTVSHGCIFKSIKVAGLADSIIRTVPSDAMYKLLPGELERLIQSDLASGLIPFMVFSNAGSTDLGSVDPIYEISLLAKRFNVWHHVDAAYGGFFMLVESQREKFRGIEMADSVTVDPHKTLFNPYGCGVVIYRDSRVAREAFSVNCNCLQDTHVDDISPADVSVELTKHFRGLRIWLPLQLFGLEAFRSCLEEKILLAKYFYRAIRRIGFTVGEGEPQLTVVIFRYEDGEKSGEDRNNGLNERLLEMIKQDGSTFVSSTMIEGKYWLRCAIVVFRTHLKNVDNCLRVLERCYKELKTLADDQLSQVSQATCAIRIKNKE